MHVKGTRARTSARKADAPRGAKKATKGAKAKAAQAAQVAHVEQAERADGERAPPDAKALRTLLGHTDVEPRAAHAQLAPSAHTTKPWETKRDLGLVADSHKVAALLPKMLCDLGGVSDLKDLGVRPLVASAGKESLFNALFGRDSIRMSFDLLDSYPAVAASTIVTLAKLQGTKVNPKGEEEPGRILHENRDRKELERIRQFEPDIDKWDFPYYGSVDATPTFVNLIGAYVERHGPALLDVKLDGERTVRDALTAAIGWVEKRLDDPRGGGFLWVQRANPHGIQNQILEDSYDSVYDEHGRLPEGPYAPVAEQGYAYKALVTAAALLDEPALAARAEELKRRFVEKFWQDDLGTFAQAVAFEPKAPEGRAFRTIASSPGQLLTSGILDDLPELRDRMVERLFQPDMLAGPGIRTKSTTAARFLEGGYHNGTVWPTISLEIKDGLLRSAAHVRHQANDARGRGDLDAATALSAKAEELMARAVDLEDRAIRAAAKFPFFPEFFRGSKDGKIRVNEEIVKKEVDGRMNTLEQPPQPQGWTATALERVLRRRGFIDDGATKAAHAAAE